jgi:hypothetical protein
MCEGSEIPSSEAFRGPDLYDATCMASFTTSITRHPRGITTLEFGTCCGHVDFYYILMIGADPVIDSTIKL